MNEITLNKYLKKHTASDLARALKITPASVAFWIKAKKEIYIKVDAKGAIKEVYEKKRLPQRKIREKGK